jgi:hypothetical protein
MTDTTKSMAQHVAERLADNPALAAHMPRALVAALPPIPSADERLKLLLAGLDELQHMIIAGLAAHASPADVLAAVARRIAVLREVHEKTLHGDAADHA